MATLTEKDLCDECVKQVYEVQRKYPVSEDMKERKKMSMQEDSSVLMKLCQILWMDDEWKELINPKLKGKILHLISSYHKSISDAMEELKND